MTVEHLLWSSFVLDVDCIKSSNTQQNLFSVETDAKGVYPSFTYLTDKTGSAASRDHLPPGAIYEVAITISVCLPNMTSPKKSNGRIM